MRYEFIQRHSNGAIWRAGRSIWGLCAAHNHATCPWIPLSEHEMRRSRQYARAIRNRMKRIGWREGEHYRENDNGLYVPMRYRPEHASLYSFA